MFHTISCNQYHSILYRGEFYSWHIAQLHSRELKRWRNPISTDGNLETKMAALPIDPCKCEVYLTESMHYFHLGKI